MDLRDKNGKIVGRIMESSDKTIRLYDSIGAYAGKYDPSSNTTYDKYGAYFGSGNLLTMLLHTA
jgi:hypothetical protein